MLTYLGSLTLSVAVPLLGLLDLTLGPFIAELQAKLAAMLKLSLAVTLTLPSVTANLMLAAAAQLALKPPQIGASASLAAAAALKLKLQIEALLQLTKWNATGGVHAFVYEGAASGLGTALQGAHVTMGVAPGQDTYAVVLLGTAGVTKTALKAVFKTP